MEDQYSPQDGHHRVGHGQAGLCGQESARVQGRPRFVRYSYESIQALAPHELTEGSSPRSRSWPAGTPAPACLMCFEAVADLGEERHRRWYAEWAQQRYGWDIPELPSPVRAVPTRSGKPKPEDPPALF
ncbi:hypothetical protein [Streptomyces sp. NPDC004675]|uniref:hypothetical protein n=1 Tax=Streptomyces sp. NPDC004675 TaxID=3154286 RepID=UPI0033AF0D4E